MNDKKLSLFSDIFSKTLMVIFIYVDIMSSIWYIMGTLVKGFQCNLNGMKIRMQ